METRPTRIAVSIMFLLAPILWAANGSNMDSTGEDMGNGLGVEDVAAMSKQKDGIGRGGGSWPQVADNRRMPDYEEEKHDEPFLELIKDGPWALIQLKGRRRNFTPRLGRDNQDEEMGFSKTSRSPPFAPRLGRRHKATVLPFSPRLGRMFNGQ